MRARNALVVAAVTVLLSSPSWAQPAAPGAATRARPGTLAERVNRLAERVDEATKAAADMPTALKALQDLQTRVTDLQRQLDRTQGLTRGFDEVRGKLDEFEHRVGELELKLSAITLQRASDPHGHAGYDGGFYIESQDRRFRLRLGGLLQVGYEGRIHAEAPSFRDEQIGEDVSTFALRRARLRLGGHLINRRLTFETELEFGTVDPGRPLLVAGGNLELFRGLQISAGKLVVPFSRQQLVHDAEQQFVDRSGASDAFAPVYDVGVMVHGEVLRRRMLAYQLGVFNGTGPEAALDDNTDFLYVGRVVFSPFGPVPLDEGDREHGPFRLSIGGAFFVDLTPTDIDRREGITDPDAVTARRDQDNDGRVDNVALYTIAGELALRYRGLAWQGEVFHRVEDPGAVAEENRRYWGLYNQLSYFYEPAGLEIGVRYGFWEPPDYGADRSVVRAGELQEISVVLAGLSWGRHIKWQAEYTHRWMRDLQRVKGADSTESWRSLNAHQIRLQGQIAF